MNRTYLALTYGLTRTVSRARRRQAHKLFEELQQKQWQPYDVLKKEQDRLRLKLLRHAFLTVPYYREALKGYELADGNFDINEWKLLPFLDKAALLENFDSLQTEDKNHSGTLNHSGGSTGKPVKFITDSQQFERMLPWLWHVFTWCGWKPGEPYLELWGNTACRLPLSFPGYIRLLLSGHLQVPVSEYSEKEMRQWYQLLLKVRPTVIYSYPSIMSDFGKWLKAEQLETPPLRGIYCSAETLFEQQREVIMDVFQCNVFDQYGSRETPCTSCECQYGNMHFFPDHNYVEFIQHSSGEEKLSDIVITPLYNFTQPLIRYRLEDLGYFAGESCPCGRVYPVMKLTGARSRDVLTGPNGINFYPGFFTRFMDGEDDIRCFQFVQHRSDLLELKVETAHLVQDSSETRKHLYEKIAPVLQSKMGDVEFRVNIVDQIKKTGAGKHRFVIKNFTSELDEKE